VSVATGRGESWSIRHANAAIATSSPRRAPVDSATMAAAIGEYLQRAEAYGFSGAVLVEVKGRPLVHAGYGLANRATGARVGTRSPFALASISKPFVASAVMLLAQRGKLAPSDSIGRFFPGVPADKRGITIHQLLTHTSGISDRGAPVAADARAFVQAVLARPLSSLPGERSRYSNLGYGILAAVVQEVGGMPYAAFMERMLFAPLGMHDTRVVSASGTPGGTHVYRGAIDFGEPRRDAAGPVRWNDVAGVGIVSTTDDLLKWERSLRRRTLLTEASQRTMFTPVAEGFGYGWVVQTTSRGTVTMSHNGLLLPEGWNSDYRRFPDDSVAIIVLSNSYREDALGWIVARNVVRLVFGGDVSVPPPVVPMPRAARASLVGDYVLDSAGRFRVREQGDRLTLHPIGQAAVNLMIFGSGRDTLGLAAANARSARLVEALRDDSLARVAGDLADVQTLPEWRTELRATWDSLVARFGAFRRHDVLHSSPAQATPTAANTYVRLYFARDSVVVRHSWNNGKLWGASDVGSFPGRHTEVEQVPAAMPMALQPDGQFAAASLVTGRTRRVRFRRDDAGKVTALDVVGATPGAVATRAGR
jgi:CubicO group peptidase (beta-lactamase class C family)